jgi:hypothetical protein
MSRPLRKSLEIDQYIDFRGMDGARRRDVAHRGNVMNRMESVAKAAAHRLAVVGSKRKTVHLEMCPIMCLEHLDQQQ